MDWAGAPEPVFSVITRKCLGLRDVCENWLCHADARQVSDLPEGLLSVSGLRPPGRRPLEELKARVVKSKTCRASAWQSHNQFCVFQALISIAERAAASRCPLSPAPQAQRLFLWLILGLAPRVLRCRPLRGLEGEGATRHTFAAFVRTKA